MRLDMQQQCSPSPRVLGVKVGICVVLNRWVRGVALGCDCLIATAQLRFRPDRLWLDRSVPLRRWLKVDGIDGIGEETFLRKYQWMKDREGHGNRQWRPLWTKFSRGLRARRFVNCRLYILSFGFRIRYW
jgi:hypothetical protein